MKRTQTIISNSVIGLFFLSVFLTPTSESAQAQGPDVQIQANGTLYGTTVCIAFEGIEMSFPFDEEYCLWNPGLERYLVFYSDENLMRYATRVSGSLEELTGRGSSNRMGPFTDPGQVSNSLYTLEWVGSVEDGVLVLEGIATAPLSDVDFNNVPVRLWVELDTGATQINYELPILNGVGDPVPGFTVHAIFFGFSTVSTIW